MVESFAWMMWDSVILMSAWGIYGVVLLRLIVGAFDFALSAGFLACCSSAGERCLYIVGRIILDRFKKYLYRIFIDIRIAALDNNCYFF